MSCMSAARVDRVIGRTLAPNVKSSQNISYTASGELLVYATGSTVAIRDLKDKGAGIESYLSLPRISRNDVERSNGSNGTPTSLSRKDSASVLSFEEFAEPSKGKEKTKPVVSVAVSPDGRWIACGEQGQAPRICIWDLKGEDPQAGPIHIINVHSYGVKHLCFSPGSHFLASIGYLHDGTIHVWDLRSGVRKVATNRVTANVRALIWLGNKLLTIGTRHIRIWSWKIESLSRRRRSSLDCKDNTAVLEGRNIVLNDHVHSDFVAACALSGHRALVATTQAICYFSADDKQPLQELVRLDYQLSSMTQRASTLITGDTRGIIRRYAFDECQALVVPENESLVPPSIMREHTQDSFEHGTQISAVFANVELTAIIALIDGSIHSCRSGHMPLTLVSGGIGALAIKQTEFDSNLLLAQEHGTIRRLNHQGQEECWDLAHDDTISVLKFLDRERVLYGTLSGQVYYTSLEHPEQVAKLQAHEGEVLSIAGAPSQGQFLTFGRDRMLQFLQSQQDTSSSELLVKQTFDEHTASITGALLLPDKYIISSSADRTIVIRMKVCVEKLELYTPSRIVDLRSMATAIVSTSDTSILISCLDKSLLTLDVESGELRELCKAEDSYELLTINARTGTCCCVSLSDKSICLRSLETGAAVSHKGHGHIDRITSVSWSLDRDDVVITTALDGMIIYWWFPPPEQSTSPSTPVRKIKTKVESLRIGFARSGNTIRRSNSVPRLGSSATPNRSLSPSKLGLDGRSPSPKRSSGYATTPTKISDGRTSPNNDRSTIKNIVRQLALLEQRKDVLESSQLTDLKSAASWLFSDSSSSILM